MNKNPKSTTSDSKPAITGLTPNEDTVNACAEACHVDQQLIECIYTAHAEQEHRMNHHISNGTYLEQMVLQFDHVASLRQQEFLIKVIDTIRIKNYILRTRLVKHEGAVYQVVLKEGSRWTIDADLEGYLRKSIKTRMGYGSELCRYALLGGEHGETFFIWTSMSGTIFGELFLS